MSKIDLVETGIVGLDQILLGGVRAGNVILVEGPAGSGKTLLGLEFIYLGATQFDQPGLIVTFEVSPTKLIRDAAEFGWDLAALEEQKKLKIIFSSPQVLSQELDAPDSLLLETAREIGAQRIFIDGIGLLRAEVNNSHNGAGNERGGYRELLQHLIENLHRENLTAMLSHEVAADGQPALTLEVTEYLVDTVIVLRREPKRRGIHRSLEIIKSRGQDFDSGRHTLRITDGEGLQVFRRVQAAPREPVDYEQPSSSHRRTVIGPEALDEMLGGGVYDGSITMAIGVSGTGKSVLAMQMLMEGAKNGEHGLMVTLDEHPSQILRNAASLGLNLKEHVDNGAIHLVYSSPQELEVDHHFSEMVRLIKEHKIQRLVLDSMTTYSGALQDRQLYREFLHGVVNYAKSHLLTCLLGYENPELFGLSAFMPDFPVSSLVDNIILLNYVELNGSHRRAITVAKARGSANQFVTREFTIGQGGIRVVPLDQNQALPALSFESYYGLLSRAPTRLSPYVLPGGAMNVLTQE